MTLDKCYVEEFARNVFSRQDIQVKPIHKEFSMIRNGYLPVSYSDLNYMFPPDNLGSDDTYLAWAFGGYSKIISTEIGDTLVCDLNACDTSVKRYLNALGITVYSSVNMFNYFQNVRVNPYLDEENQIVIPYGATKVSGNITNLNRPVVSCGLHYLVSSQVDTNRRLNCTPYTPSYFLGQFYLPDRVYLQTSLIGVNSPSALFSNETPTYPTINQTPLHTGSRILTAQAFTRFFNAHIHTSLVEGSYGFSFSGWEILPQLSGSYPSPESFPLLPSI